MLTHDYPDGSEQHHGRGNDEDNDFNHLVMPSMIVVRLGCWRGCDFGRLANLSGAHTVAKLT